MKKSLVAEALADLREMKELAIEDARIRLAETVTPEIKAILEAKLDEDAAEEEEDEAAKMEDAAEEEESAKPEDESLDIEAALAEVEKSQAEGGKKEEEEEEEGVKKEGEDEEGEENPDDSKEKTPEEGEEDAPEVEPGDDEDEIDEDYINRIMAEVENSEEEEEDESMKKEGEEEEGEEQEEMNEGPIKDILDKIKALPSNLKKAWDEKYSPAAMAKPGAKAAVLPSNLEGKKEEEEEEGYKTETEAMLEQLKTEISDLSVLSAKLMFQNKLLISENFSDQQKARIIKAFDKAGTVNEAKIIFETLKGASTTKKPFAKPISESLGFKPIGGAKTVIKESADKKSYDTTDPVVANMMKRAGILK